MTANQSHGNATLNATKTVNTTFSQSNISSNVTANISSNATIKGNSSANVTTLSEHKKVKSQKRHFMSSERQMELMAKGNKV